jgi:cell division septation protein DedD
MPKNEDGEFELILGNRQLMSVFFIVVILLGVCFALGYKVGQNASPVAVSDSVSRRAESKPLVETPAAPKEPATQEVPATQPAPPEPVKAPVRAETSTQPESGRTYLQLSATNHDAAEIMVELLRKKKFPALSVERPEKPGSFRVLVGPISDADLNKTRADLDAASFPGKDAIKRTF